MSTTPAVPVPAEYAALVDDASALRPASPAEADGSRLAVVVAEHRDLLDLPYAGVLGALVVADDAVPELRALVAEAGGQGPPLRLRVVVSAGAGGVEPVVRWCAAPGLELSSIEVALRDPDDLAANVRRVAAAGQSAGLDGATVLIRPPNLVGLPSPLWLAALDEVAAADLGLVLDAARADAAAVSAFLDAALDREVPFAVRGVARAVHTEGHGVLNLLLATRACLDGDDVVRVLADSDAASVVDRLRAAGSDPLVRARRWLRSVAAPGAAAPLADLVALGLVPDPRQTGSNTPS